jgi:methionine biosynthesis protein MetW
MNPIKKVFNKDFPELFNNYREYHENFKSNLKRAKIIADWIEPNSTVLDVGCGDGTIAEYLVKNKNAKVEGIDIVKSAEKKGIKVKIQDLNRGLKIDKKYDYIILIEVLEHLQFPQVVLNKVRKFAKKGVIVSIPNSGWLIYRLQLLFGISPRQSFTHLHYWTHNDFILFSEKCGLDVVKSYSTYWSEKKFMDLIARIWPNLLGNNSFYILKDKSS